MNTKSDLPRSLLLFLPLVRFWSGGISYVQTSSKVACSFFVHREAYAVIKKSISYVLVVDHQCRYTLLTEYFDCDKLVAAYFNSFYLFRSTLV